ncbi:MAG: hydroxyacid dehydrogenase [Candidatus Hadarchaeales archaeon]
MPVILVSDHLHPDGVEELKKLGEVRVKTGLPPSELLKEVEDVDVLVVRSATKVTREVLEAGKRLKIVARAGVGLDNIDQEAAKERGIKVLNAPESVSVAVAELVLGLMLSWCRRIPAADASMRQGKWEKSKFMGIELRGKTLGILGTGRIGLEVARRAKAFGMRLLGHDIVQSKEFLELGGEYVGLEDLLRNSDFVSLHVPLNEQTRNMLGERELRMMKPTAVLINTSRGAVVQEEALLKALREGWIAGACLDVYWKEPISSDHPLLQLSNVVLTPHLGASTEEAQREAALVVAEKIRREI